MKDDIKEVIDPIEGTEEAETTEALKTSFMISDGKEDVKVVASKRYWMIQRLRTSVNPETKVETKTWTTEHYVTDIGSVANRIFDMRLKNSDTTTLEELSKAGKKIDKDIRKEFGLMVA